MTPARRRLPSFARRPCRRRPRSVRDPRLRARQRNPSPSRSARRASAAASEPASGSLSANAATLPAGGQPRDPGVANLRLARGGSGSRRGPGARVPSRPPCSRAPGPSRRRQSSTAEPSPSRGRTCPSRPSSPSSRTSGRLICPGTPSRPGREHVVPESVGSLEQGLLGLREAAVTGHSGTTATPVSSTSASGSKRAEAPISAIAGYRRPKWRRQTSPSSRRKRGTRPCRS